MIKVITIGDLHAAYPKLWQILDQAQAVDPQGLPTPPVLSGNYRVIMMGDLIHPKRLYDYIKLTGVDAYNSKNSEHLHKAAQAQIEQL